MKVDIAPGKYVLAVSGGVDSIVLLDILAKQAKSQKLKAKSSDIQLSANSLQLVVVHFNHGIREDSVKDEQLVKQTVKKLSLPIEVGYGKLGKGASEEQARNARYKFLEKIKKKHQADGIITAHHQDDLIETALLNILRGTHRKGLSSIRSVKVHRPLLGVPKKAILAYAKRSKLKWREDESNQDSKYQRNYLRNQILPNLSAAKRAEILENLDKVAKLNVEIDNNIATLSHVLRNNKLNRQAFIMLPPQVADELLIFWLKKNKLGQFDAKTVKRLSTSVKTGLAGAKQPVYGQWQVRLDKHSASLMHP